MKNKRKRRQFGSPMRLHKTRVKDYVEMARGNLDRLRDYDLRCDYAMDLFSSAYANFMLAREHASEANAYHQGTETFAEVERLGIQINDAHQHIRKSCRLRAKKFDPMG